MDDSEFWRIIGLFNWQKAGDDEAVLKPAIKELAKKSIQEIAAFEEILSQIACSRHKGTRTKHR